MLVESLALREANNARALAVKHRWLDTDIIPKKSYAGHSHADRQSGRICSRVLGAADALLQRRFSPQRRFRDVLHESASRPTSSIPAAPSAQAFRYGLTAGRQSRRRLSRTESAIGSIHHPNNVFSPEAVAAWGDMNTLLQFYAAQVLPTNDSQLQVRHGARLRARSRAGFRPTPAWSITCSCCLDWSRASTRISSPTAFSALRPATTTPTASWTRRTTPTGDRRSARRRIAGRRQLRTASSTPPTMWSGGSVTTSAGSGAAAARAGAEMLVLLLSVRPACWRICYRVGQLMPVAA